MPFLLKEIVQAASEADTFKGVSNLVLDFDDAYTNGGLAEFMRLFDPAILTSINVLSPYLEVFPLIEGLGFRSIRATCPKNIAGLQRAITRSAETIITL